MLAALGLVIALVATLFYQSLYKEPIWHLQYFTGGPFLFSSLVHTLWLDAGYLATIALVSWLFRMATRPAIGTDRLIGSRASVAAEVNDVE